MDGDPRQFGCVQFMLVGTNGLPVQSLMLSYIIHVHLDGPYVLSTFKFVTQSVLITKQLCLDTVLKPPSRSFTFQFLYVIPPPIRSI